MMMMIMKFPEVRTGGLIFLCCLLAFSLIVVGLIWGWGVIETAFSFFGTIGEIFVSVPIVIDAILAPLLFCFFIAWLVRTLRWSHQLCKAINDDITNNLSSVSEKTEKLLKNKNLYDFHVVSKFLHKFLEKTDMNISQDYRKDCFKKAFTKGDEGSSKTSICYYDCSKIPILEGNLTQSGEKIIDSEKIDVRLLAFYNKLAKEMKEYVESSDYQNDLFMEFLFSDAMNFFQKLIKRSEVNWKNHFSCLCFAWDEGQSTSKILNKNDSMIKCALSTQKSFSLGFFRRSLFNKAEYNYDRYFTKISLDTLRMFESIHIEMSKTKKDKTTSTKSTLNQTREKLLTNLLNNSKSATSNIVNHLSLKNLWTNNASSSESLLKQINAKKKLRQSNNNDSQEENSCDFSFSPNNSVGR